MVSKKESQKNLQNCSENVFTCMLQPHSGKIGELKKTWNW